MFYVFYFGLISRTGELLNLRSEKINVLVVNKAIQESLEGWDGATLVEWACAESPLMHDDKNGNNLKLCMEQTRSINFRSIFDKFRNMNLNLLNFVLLPDGEYDMYYLLFVELESEKEIRLSADQMSMVNTMLSKKLTTVYLIEL